MIHDLQATIDVAWERRDEIGPATRGPAREAVEAALALLDTGRARVAEPVDGGWRVQQWLKKSVLLSFRLNDAKPIAGGPGGGSWYDKVFPKFRDWDDERFLAAGFRAVPAALFATQPL